MRTRRGTGELEASVLQYLWALGAPATPPEVHEAVAPDLAYTTVMTVLARLFDKEVLARQRRGRAYEYWPVGGEAGHRATRMLEQLAAANDPTAVLSSFVEALDESEADELRQLLEGDGS